MGGHVNKKEVGLGEQIASRCSICAGGGVLPYERQLTHGRTACGLLRYNATKPKTARRKVIDAGFLEIGAVSKLGTNMIEYRVTKSVS